MVFPRVLLNISEVFLGFCRVNLGLCVVFPVGFRSVS